MSNDYPLIKTTSKLETKYSIIMSKKIHNINENFSKYQNELEKQTILLQNSAKHYKNAKKALHEWAYKMLNITAPTEAEIEKEAEEYINRPINYKTLSSYQMQKHFDKAEETEALNQDIKITDEMKKEIEKIKSRRRAKFYQMRKEKLKEILLNATIKFKGPLISKFAPPSPIPKEIQEFDKFSIQTHDIKNRISKIEHKLYELKLQKEKAEYGPIWFSAHDKVVTQKIDDTSGEMYIALFHIANAFFSSGQYELGTFASLDGKIMRFVDKTHLARDDMNPSLTTHLICSNETVIYSATRLCPSVYEAHVGLPEACEESFTDEGFTEYLSEVSPFLSLVLHSD